MKKAESLSAIVKLWQELPEEEQTTLNFHSFYHSLETNHQDVLKWRDLSGRRENEVKAHLLNKGFMKVPSSR